MPHTHTQSVAHVFRHSQFVVALILTRVDVVQHKNVTPLLSAPGSLGGEDSTTKATASPSKLDSDDLEGIVNGGRTVGGYGTLNGEGGGSTTTLPTKSIN